MTCTGSQVCQWLCGSVQTGLVCDASASTVGICRTAPPSYTDLGQSCMSNASCQSNLCSSDLGDLCSADCSGIMSCPSGSLCITNQAGSSLFCARECTPGTAGNMACAALATGSSCVRLGNGSGVCADLTP